MQAKNSSPRICYHMKAGSAVLFVPFCPCISPADTACTAHILPACVHGYVHTGRRTHTWFPGICFPALFATSQRSLQCCRSVIDSTTSVVTVFASLSVHRTVLPPSPTPEQGSGEHPRFCAFAPHFHTVDPSGPVAAGGIHKIIFKKCCRGPPVASAGLTRLMGTEWGPVFSLHFPSSELGHLLICTDLLGMAAELQPLPFQHLALAPYGFFSSPRS